MLPVNGLLHSIAVPVRVRGEIAAVFELFDSRRLDRDEETERTLALAVGELAARLAAGPRVS
jgi:hypothetical protein